MSCIICLASIFCGFQITFTYSAPLRDERKIKTTPTYQCLCSSHNFRMTFSFDGTLVLAPCVDLNTDLNNDVDKNSIIITITEVGKLSPFETDLYSTLTFVIFSYCPYILLHLRPYMISWRFRHPLIHTRLYSKAAFLNLPSALDAPLLRRSYEPKLKIT